MCEVMEEMRNEAVWQAKVESVLCQLKKGLSIEDFAEDENMPVDQVERIAALQSMQNELPAAVIYLKTG